MLISLIEEERQLFAASTGMSICETSRDESFCAHAILKKRIMVIPDTRKDPRFRDNPLVTGEPHIRFYAGIPLRTPSGFPIGVLCIIDNKPRSSLSARDAHNLQDFAALVMDKLEMRRLDLARRASQARFESIAESSPDAILCVNDRGTITFWNESAEKMLEYNRDQIIGEHISIIVPDMFVVQLHHLATDKTAIFKGSSIELETRALSGTLISTELTVSMWRDHNQTRYGIILRDVTERQRYEERLFLQAHRDPLTGLANRTLLTSTLDQVLKKR
ncbi:hypothetical protein DZJ_03940 [Dickeya ananatis]